MTTQDGLYDKLLQFTKNRGFTFNIDECNMVRSFTSYKKVKAHSILMEQGKPVKKFYFLNSGIVRLFRVHNGVDYTLGIVSTNDFVSTLLYLANGSPSSCALETLTETELLEWGKAEVTAIKSQLNRAQELEMAIIDRLLNWLQDHQIDAVCLTAEERYQKLMEQQPEVIRTIPLKYIASYLGIHQDSLSRIRKIVSRKT